MLANELARVKPRTSNFEGVGLEVSS